MKNLTCGVPFWICCGSALTACIKNIETLIFIFLKKDSGLSLKGGNFTGGNQSLWMTNPGMLSTLGKICAAVAATCGRKCKEWVQITVRSSKDLTFLVSKKLLYGLNFFFSSSMVKKVEGSDILCDPNWNITRVKWKLFCVTPEDKCDGSTGRLLEFRNLRYPTCKR